MNSRFIGCSTIIFLSLYTANLSPVDAATDEELARISLRLYKGKTLDADYNDAVAGEAFKLLENFDVLKPTVFYIHGFTENLNRTSVRTVVGAYLVRGDHNVLAIDWSEIASKNYLIVAGSASGVGKILAQTLTDMVSRSLDPKTVHVVGHSLGGEIAGYIGRNVDFKIPRITGLDPAGPGFYIIVEHLASSDAQFVDVIHTDAGIYGLAIRSGGADFYPNGGTRIQPGCPRLFLILDSNDFCSHYRSWEYYAESLANEKAFVSVECDSNQNFRSKRCANNRKVPMGFATPVGTKGKFYLQTKDRSPYGRGEDGVNPIQ